MLDQRRQIAVFARTVDHGSSRAAARALRLSPSVLIHHVTELECQLGTARMYRSPSKLSLTLDGEMLLAAARTMLEAAETGLQEVSSQKQQPSGLLRVTVPAVLAQSRSVDRITHFALGNPNVRLSLDFSDVRRKGIGDGYDIAIRMDWLEDSSLNARKLFDVERCLVAAPSYLKTRSLPDRPEEPADWDWRELTPVWHKKAEFRNGGECVVVAIRNSRISVHNADALHRMARVEAGLAVIPDILKLSAE